MLIKRKWTKSEDEQLIEYKKDNIPDHEIASALGRTVGAIVARQYTIGIIIPHAPKEPKPKRKISEKSVCLKSYKDGYKTCYSIYIGDKLISDYDSECQALATLRALNEAVL